MEGGFNVILIVLLATAVSCVPEERLRRGYDDARGDDIGYGGDSDEREGIPDHDHEHAPCGLLEDNSGSPEHGYEFDDRPGQESRRGFSVKAAAAASSSTYK